MLWKGYDLALFSSDQSELETAASVLPVAPHAAVAQRAGARRKV
ncbi:MAG: hypothetical protein K0S81_3325 [Rhodospirillales bacterium]|nr:hypothetical protein [Rhodospirillales bacterium]